MEHNNLQSNTQSNRTYNASFTPNFAHNARQQQEQPQARPVPPLGNAPDLYAHLPARNLQDYNTIRPIELDPLDLSEYQPIKPGEPYMEKLADEAMNTKKVELFLKHAQEYEELGDFKDAEKAYKKALKYTDNVEPYKLYATCLRQVYLTLSQALTKDEARERIYREKAARAFYYLGELYEKQGAWNPAQTAYKASGELACYEASLQALVALARQLGEARELANTLEKLADFYAEKGAIALAIEKLKEAFELGKSFAILDKLEALYGKTGGEDSQLNVNKTCILRFELQVQTLQQKLVKQKTKIGGLKQTIHSQDGKLETLEKQVEFLGRQVIHLDFSHCPAMQDADFIPLLMHNSYVQSLSLEGCEHLTDAVLRVLPERFSNLQELNLKRCKGVTEAGLNTLAEKASKLKRLTLDYCPGTTITVLHKLNVKGIVFTIEGVVFKKMDLISCPDMKDDDLLPLLKKNPYVQSLSLEGCEHLTDAVLRVLPERFSNLQELNLTKCKGVTEAGLYAIVEKATKLKRLTLDYCPATTIKLLHKLNAKKIAFTIEGVVFKKNVLDLSQHKYSCISDKNLKDTELLKALEDNPEITELNLSNCTKITGAGLAPLKGFQWLTSLNLSLDPEIIDFRLSRDDFGQLTDAGLRHLAGLTQLTSLDLGGCAQLTDAAVKELAGLTRLTELDLSNCKKLTDEGLRHLAGLTQLTSLSLGGCVQLTDAAVKELAGLTQLKWLSLSGCTKLTDEGLRHLVGLTQLTSLSLGRCTQLSDAGMKHLTGLTQLASLDLYGCKQLTDEGLEELISLTRLSSLDLCGCKQLTGAGLRQLARSTWLSELNLQHCEQLSDVDLELIADCTQLTVLQLAYCTQFTDEGLAYLGRLFRLRNLNLYNCKQLTDKGLELIGDLKHFNRLTTLHLGGCTRLTRKAKEQLKQRRQQLRVLD